MLVYATPAELVAFRGGRFTDDAVSLLGRASRLVRHASRRAVYRTDGEGLPVDVGVREAFMRATCAQAAFWAEQREREQERVESGTPDQQVKAATFGSTRIEYVTGGDASGDVQVELSPDGLCRDAWDELAWAGLLTGPTRVRSLGWW